MNTEAASLKKAIRIQFKSARAFIQLARGAGSAFMKAEYVKMARACRENVSKYRTSLRGVS